MNKVMQSDLLKLAQAAAKCVPGRKQLRENNFILREKQFVHGQGRIWVDTVNFPMFEAVTLEFHASGIVSATVHAFDGNTPVCFSIPLTVKANVTTPFRATVFADVLVPLLKLHKKEALNIEYDAAARRLTISTPSDIDRFNCVEHDVYYDWAKVS